jgi:ribosomal protein S17
MATKAQVTGVVVSDKMNKTVKVAIERQIRDPLYGKTSKRTSTFLAHDEKNEAKVGDRSRSPRPVRSAPASAGW